MLESARRRGLRPDHLLFSARPGLGKTSLAAIVAAELGSGFRVTSRPGAGAGRRPGCHPLPASSRATSCSWTRSTASPRAVEEVLYPAMEDFQIDVVLGKGPGARSLRLDLPRFALVAATTRTGLITSPLRDQLRVLGPARLLRPGRASVDRHPLGGHPREVTIDAVEAGSLAGGPAAPQDRQPAAAPGSRLRRGQADGAVDEAWPRPPSSCSSRPPWAGQADRPWPTRVLCGALRRRPGRPGHLLAVSVGESRTRSRTWPEPYLLQLWLPHRTPRGRVATAAAFAHLGLEGREPRRRARARLLFEPEGREG